MRSQKTNIKSLPFKGVRKAFFLLIALLCFKSSFAVGGEDVYEYLIEQGYRVTSVQLVKDSDDWVSTNEDGSHTLVLVEKDAIVGHQDIEW